MIFPVVVNYAIGTIGIIGNLMVLSLIVFIQRLRKLHVNWLLFNQSCIDLLASIFIMILPNLNNQLAPNMSTIQAALSCRLWKNALPFWALLTASTYNLIAISADRFMAVNKPIKYRIGNGKWVSTSLAIGAWFMGFSLHTIINSLTIEVKGDRCVMMTKYSSESWRKLTGIILITIQFLVPLAIFISVYVLIMRKLRSPIVDPILTTEISAVDSTEGTSTNTAYKARMLRNVNKTLLTVIVACVVLNSPNQIMFFAYNLGYKLPIYGWIHNTTIILIFANCCINPFIYVFKYELFRKTLMVLLRISSEKN